MRMLRIPAGVLLRAAVAACSPRLADPRATPRYRDPAAPIDARVEDLLARVERSRDADLASVALEVR